MAIAATKRRIDASAQSDDHLAEAALPDVIARAKHERPIRGLEFVFDGWADIARARSSCRNKSRSSSNDLARAAEPAVGHKGDARAIKQRGCRCRRPDSRRPRDAMFARDRPQHIVADRTLVERVGGTGNIQKDRASLPGNLGYRIAVVELLSPEAFVVPGVFADRDAELFVVKREDVLGMRGLEVARFVEDVVGRQQHFALLEEDFSSGDQSRRVRDGLAGLIHCVANEAYDRGYGNGLCQPHQRFLIVLDKGWPFDEVLRRISAKAQFGEDR